jgi:hypothetical protein
VNSSSSFSHITQEETEGSLAEMVTEDAVVDFVEVGPFLPLSPFPRCQRLFAAGMERV